MMSRIQDPLAMEILDGEVLPGDSLTVDTDMKRGEMRFERVAVRTVR
jgi:hypothetical protein